MSGTGQWTDFRNLSSEDTQVLKAALKGFVGVTYDPLLVATQVVAGINYCFVCTATPATQKPTEFAALVYIWQHPGGDCQLTEIKRLNP